MLRLKMAVALVLVVGLAGCTTPADEAPAAPDESVAAFVTAWNEEDFEAVHHLLSDSPRQREWHSGALRVYWNDLMRAGEIEDFEVALGDEIEGTSDFEYSITYDSRAAKAPITLDGGRLTALEKGGEWVFEWSRRLPFAGETRAKGFRVEEDWGRRGAIRDRDGRPLAVGGYASRSYPAGTAAGTMVGHLEPPPERAPTERLIGASGVEEAFDERLAGVPRRRLVLSGRRDEIVRRFGWIAGEDGRSVKLTLDLSVQRAAEGAFGSTVGGAVVLDPSNGDILGAVSSSAFDPGNYVGAANVEPFDRALSGRYPPGSALKVMTAAAALDTGEVKPTTELTGPKEYRGVRNFESGEFGTIDFATALKYSVNTAFAQVALRLGPRKLFRYANAFGFNDAPAMALAAGTSSFPEPLDEGDLMWGSIGQAQVLATPLQMATVAATIANDGRRMEPRIDLRADPEGERVVTVKTARTMKELMRDVVIGGTGVAANVSGLDVAGKTGTAEVDVAGERKNHAWFICFAPAADPKVAVAVVAEYGGVGGQVAAPLARSILTAVWPHLR